MKNRMRHDGGDWDNSNFSRILHYESTIGSTQILTETKGN